MHRNFAHLPAETAYSLSTLKREPSCWLRPWLPLLTAPPALLAPIFQNMRNVETEMEESFLYQQEEGKSLLISTFYTECPSASLLPGMWWVFSAESPLGDRHCALSHNKWSRRKGHAGTWLGSRIGSCLHNSLSTIHYFMLLPNLCMGFQGFPGTPQEMS